MGVYSVDVFHVTFDTPSSTEVLSRLLPAPGNSEAEMVRRLCAFHRQIDGIRTCYNHVTKVINADQPKADVFSQGKETGYNKNLN